MATFVATFERAYSCPSERLVDPLLEPIRRAIPYNGPVDFSPVIAVLILILIERIVLRALAVLL